MVQILTIILILIGSATAQVLPIANGGTNATTASDARTNLGVAAAGASTEVNGQTCALGSTCTVTTAPGGTAGGDLSGSFPNPTVSGLGGVPYASIPTPALANVICYDGVMWTPCPAAAGPAQILYLTDTASDIGGYDLWDTAPLGGQFTVANTIPATTTKTLIKAFATVGGYPNITTIPAGEWQIDVYAQVSSSANTTTINTDVYKRASGGSETLLFSFNDITASSDGTGIQSLTTQAVEPAFTLLTSDRLVIKLSMTKTGGASITGTVYGGGAVNYTHIHTPLGTATGGVTSITATAPLTGGTITSSGSIGCPTAATAQDGCLTSTDWNTFNGKQAALSLAPGTYSDGKMCTYASSGTLLNCNTDIPTGGASVCDPSDITQLCMVEDFFTGDSATGRIGTNGLATATIVSGGSQAYIAGTAANPGLLRMNTVATQGNGWYVAMLNSGPIYPISLTTWATKNWDIDIILIPGSNSTGVTDVRMRVGLVNSLSAVPTAGAWIRLDKNASYGDTTFMFQICKSGTGCNAASTGTDTTVLSSTITPTAGTPYRFHIRRVGTGANSVCFYVNSEAEQCMADTNFQTSASASVAVLYVTDSTNIRSVDVDRMLVAVFGLSRF